MLFQKEISFYNDIAKNGCNQFFLQKCKKYSYWLNSSRISNIKSNDNGAEKIQSLLFRFASDIFYIIKDFIYFVSTHKTYNNAGSETKTKTTFTDLRY